MPSALSVQGQFFRSNAGGLNAVLTDNTGKVTQVVAVNGTTGAYSFDQAIANNSYKVVLSTTDSLPARA